MVSESSLRLGISHASSSGASRALAAPAAHGGATRRRRKTRENALAVVTMKQLLESGVHSGHQTRRWNPKMKRFIFMERNGIHIIDVQSTLSRFDAPNSVIPDLA